MRLPRSSLCQSAMEFHSLCINSIGMKNSKKPLQKLLTNCVQVYRCTSGTIVDRTKMANRKAIMKEQS